MRKHIIGNGPRDVSAAEQGWLDFELLAQVYRIRFPGHKIFLSRLSE